MRQKPQPGTLPGDATGAIIYLRNKLQKVPVQSTSLSLGFLVHDTGTVSVAPVWEFCEAARDGRLLGARCCAHAALCLPGKGGLTGQVSTRGWAPCFKVSKCYLFDAPQQTLHLQIGTLFLLFRWGTRKLGEHFQDEELRKRWS